MSAMENLRDFVAKNRWPAGFAENVMDSKDRVAYRFLVVDNSRSMLKPDGHRLVIDRYGIQSYVECSRWEEISGAVKTIACLADAAETPTEIRLLNKSEPSVVGLGTKGDRSALSNVISQLSIDPGGQTPLCRQLSDIISQLRDMERELRSSNKIAVLIIMTDCESTDGNIIDVLKLLEGFPLQIIIRMCSDESHIIEYWQSINAQLDLDIEVLGQVKTEALVVAESNNWLTYAEPLHRLREFGVVVPAIHNLDLRQLSKQEIKMLAQILIGSEKHSSLPDPDTNWENFMATLQQISESSPKVFCPLERQAIPWIDINRLMDYAPDPVRLVVEKNEGLLWKIYVFYAFNAALIRRLELGAQKRPAATRLRAAPVFRSAAKYEKKLLNQDDLWQLFKDFEFVPFVVNTVRFNRMMSQLPVRKGPTDVSKAILCFREFIKVMTMIADVAYPYQRPAKRVERLFSYMERSGNLGRMKDTGKVESSPDMTLVFNLTGGDEMGTSMDSERDHTVAIEPLGAVSKEDAELMAKANVQKSVGDLLAKRAAESLLKKGAHDSASDALALRTNGDVVMDRLQVIEQEIGAEKARAVDAAVGKKITAFEAEKRQIEAELEKAKKLISVSASQNVRLEDALMGYTAEVSARDKEIEALRNTNSSDNKTLHTLQNQLNSSKYQVNNAKIENEELARSHHQKLTEINSSIASFTNKLKNYRDKELQSASDTAELQEALTACNDVLQDKEDELSLLKYQQSRNLAEIADLTNQVNHLECELASGQAHFLLERQALLAELQNVVAKVVASELIITQQAADLSNEKLLFDAEQKKAKEQADLVAKLTGSLTVHETEVKEMQYDSVADKQAQSAVITGLNELLESLQKQLQDADEEIAANKADSKELVRCHTEKLHEVNSLLASLTHELNETRALLDARAHNLIELKGSLKDKTDRITSLLDQVEEIEEEAEAAVHQHQIEIEAARQNAEIAAAKATHDITTLAADMLVVEGKLGNSRFEVVALKMELEGLKKTAATKQHELESKGRELQSNLEAATKQLHAARDKLEMSIAESAAEERNLQNKLRGVEAELQDARATALAEKTLQDGINKELVSNLEDSKQDILSLQSDFDSLAAESTKQALNVEQQLAALKLEIERLTKELEKKNLEVAGLKKKIEAIMAESLKEKNDILSRLEKKTSELGGAQAQLEDWKTLAAAGNGKAADLQSANGALAAELEKSRSDAAARDMEAKLNQADLTSAIANLKAEITRSKEQIVADDATAKKVAADAAELHKALQLELQNAHAAAASGELKAKESIAILTTKIEGLAAGIEKSEAQLARRDASSKEDIGALNAKLAGLQANLDATKALVIQTQSAADLELGRVKAQAAAAESAVRTELAVLSTKHEGLAAELVKAEAQAASDAAKAEEHASTLSGKIDGLLADLNSARNESAKLDGQAKVQIAAITEKVEGLLSARDSARTAAEYQEARRKEQLAALQAEKDSLVNELHSARDSASASVADMQKRLDASDALMNSSELEKQELVSGHAEKLAEMKNLVATFTQRLKDAQAKEAASAADMSDLSQRESSLKDELTVLRTKHDALVDAHEADKQRMTVADDAAKKVAADAAELHKALQLELQNAHAAAASGELKAKESIAILTTKIEGLAAGIEKSEAQLARRDASSKEDIGALNAKLAGLQANLDAAKALVIQTQSAADLELGRVKAQAAAAESAVRTELAVLSTKHEGLAAELEKAEAQAASDAAKAEEHASTLSGKIDGLLADLNSARNESAKLDGQAKVQIAAITEKVEGLLSARDSARTAAEYQEARRKEQLAALQAEKDSLVNELHSARDSASASVADMQKRLDASDALMNSSELEKQELVSGHAEKLAEMKNLVTTFTQRLKDAQAKEAASAADMSDLSQRESSLKDELTVLRTKHDALVDAYEADKQRMTVADDAAKKVAADAAELHKALQLELQNAHAAAASGELKAKESIAILTTKIEGLAAGIEKSEAQLARRDASSKEDIGALNAKLAGLQANLDAAKALVIQTQSAADLELGRVKAQAAAAESAVRTELAVLSTKHEGLAAELEKAEAQAASDAAKAEEHASTLSGKIDGLLAEVHSAGELASASVAAMQKRLDASDALMNSSELEKQELVSGHAEKLAEMKNLVATFTQRLKDAQAKEAASAADVADLRAAAAVSAQKLEEKSKEVGAVQGQLAALEGTVSHERDVRMSEVQGILASAAASEAAMKDQIAALQSKYDGLQDKHERSLVEVAADSIRAKEHADAVLQANQDLRIEAVNQLDAAYGKLKTEMAVVSALNAVQATELLKGADNFSALVDEKRLLQAELSDALEGRLNGDEALSKVVKQAAVEESRSREQIAVLSTKIDGLLVGLEVRKAQSTAHEQRARDQIAKIEKDKHDISLELNKVRAEAAAAESAVRTELAVLSTKHEGLAAELEKAEAQAASDAAKAEEHASTLSGKIDGLLAEVHSAGELASASVAAMQKRLDASDALMNSSELEKQELVSGHAEKLAEMKNLVATFTQRLKDAQAKEAASAADVADLRAAAAVSAQKLEEKSKEVGAVQGQLAALEGTVSHERDVRMSEVQGILASAAASEAAMKDQIAALQSKYDGLQDKHERSLVEVAAEDARAQENATSLLQANHELRLDLERSAGLAGTTKSKHENEMAAVMAAKDDQQAALDRSAESLIALSADYRQLEKELSEALEAKNNAAAEAAELESRSREQIAVLSTKIDGMTVGLEVRKAQSTAHEQRARDQIAKIEKDKHDISLELNKVRAEAAAAESAVRTELAVLSTKHEGLAAELEKAEAQAASDAAKAEEHASTLSGKIDGLLAEVHSAGELASASVAAMQKRLDASDALMNSSELEKQELVSGHAEKLAEMKNLVATFTQRLKDAQAKEAASAADVADLRAAAAVSAQKLEEKSKEVGAVQGQLAALEGTVSHERDVRMSEVQGILASAAASEAAMKDQIAALQSKYDGLQDKHERSLVEVAAEDARAKDTEAQLRQAYADLRVETANQIDQAYAKLQKELALVIAAKDYQQLKLDQSAESLVALSAEKLALRTELTETLSAKLSAEAALVKLAAQAASDESRAREQIAVLSAKIDGLMAGLAVRDARSAADEQKARDQIAEMEKDKQGLVLELHKARAQAAVEHSQLSVKLAVLASKHEGLAVDLQRAEALVAKNGAKAERQMTGVLADKDRLVKELNSARELAASSKSRLESSDAEANATEREKQELIADHAEKLAEMKNLVATTTQRLQEVLAKEAASAADVTDLRAAAAVSAQKLEEKSQEVGAVQGQLAALEGTVSHERDLRVSEVKNILTSAAASETTLRAQMATLQSKYESLQSKNERSLFQVAGNELRAKETEAALRQANADLRAELDRSGDTVNMVQAQLNIDLIQLQAASKLKQAELDRNAASLTAISAEKRKLESELTEAVGQLSKSREQIAVLSTKIDGMTVGLEVRKAQSTAHEQRARDQIAKIEKDKHDISLELNKVRAEAAAAESAVRTELAVLSTKHEGLAAELVKAEAQAASDAAKAEEHASTLSGKIDGLLADLNSARNESAKLDGQAKVQIAAITEKVEGLLSARDSARTAAEYQEARRKEQLAALQAEKDSLVNELHSARDSASASVADMQKRLDASDVEEREKQELVSGHAEKLAEMKNLVTTFTQRLKDAQAKEAASAADVAEMRASAAYLEKKHASLQSEYDALRESLERSLVDGAVRANKNLKQHENDIAIIIEEKEGQQAELSRSEKSLTNISSEKRKLETELTEARVTASNAVNELKAMSNKVDTLTVGLEIRQAKAAVKEQNARDEIVDLKRERHDLLQELDKARAEAVDTHSKVSNDVLEVRALLTSSIQKLKASIDREALLSAQVASNTTAAAAAAQLLDDKARELHELQSALDRYKQQIDDLTKKIRDGESGKSNPDAPLDSDRELSALQFRLTESRAQLSTLSRQAADSEEEAASQSSLVKSEKVRSEKLQKEIDTLRSGIEKDVPASEMIGINANLTATLKKQIAKIAEQQEKISAFEAEAALLAKSKASQFAPFSGQPSCYLCRSTLESIGADEERNRILNAEAARVRALNEELIAEIAAEERKTIGLSSAPESFSFENPMARSTRSPKGGPKKESFSTKGADETKSSAVSNADPDAAAASLKKQLDERQRGQALAAQIAAVLEDNESKVKDLKAAKSQRELLEHAIAAEEEVARSLQDRAADAMEERSKHSNIAQEGEKSLALLAEATLSSRDRFLAATAIFETEKVRAEAAEKTRIFATEALARAIEANEKLLAALAAEEERTVNLNAAAALASQINKERASTAAISEKTSLLLSKALDNTRAEIAEKEKQLEIHGDKSRRLDKSLDEVLSVPSGSISPTSESTRKGMSKVLSEKGDFGDSDSDETNKSPTEERDNIPPSGLLKRLFPKTSAPIPLALNLAAATVPSQDLLRSPSVMHRPTPVPRDSVILHQKGLTRAIGEHRIATAMENEAKKLAEKIKEKRDAIRSAVDGSLSNTREPSFNTDTANLSCTSSISSDWGGISPRAEGAGSIVDDDDESTLGNFQAASQNLLSAYGRKPVDILLDGNKDILWQIFFFYSHHASAVRPKMGRMESPTPTTMAHAALALSGTAKYDEKLLQHENFVQMLNDFKLMSRINFKWFDTLVDTQERRGSHHTCNSYILLSFREFLRCLLKISEELDRRMDLGDAFHVLLSTMRDSNQVLALEQSGLIDGKMGQFSMKKAAGV